MKELDAIKNLMELMPQAALVVSLDSQTIVLQNSIAAQHLGLEVGNSVETISAIISQSPSPASIQSAIQAELETENKSILHHINVQTLAPDLEHYDLHISYVDQEKSAVYLIFAQSAHELHRMAQQNTYFDTLSQAAYSYPFHLDVTARRITLYDPELEKFNLPLSMDNFPEPVLASGVLCPDDLEPYLQTVDRMYKGLPPKGSFRFYDPQGELLTYTVNYVVNRDALGNPIEVNGDFIIQSEMKMNQPKQKVVLAHQIKAHFFFNTLNTISALCKQDAAKADSAIRTFATYMRSYMHLVSENENIPFAQELTLIKSTLEIEKIRFPGSFVYELDLQEQDFAIPPLTLQPLVENALLHGLRRTGRHGTLKISSKKVGATIQIIVSDNGMGFNTEILNQTKSIGLKNLTKRMELMAGGHVTIHSEPGHGTQSIIEIPLIDIPQQVEVGS